MIFKFFFEDDGEFLECKNYNLKKLTEAMKSSNEVPVKFKLEVIDLDEGKRVQNLKLFLTEASSLGVYSHLIDRPLESQVDGILEFENDSGLNVSLDNTTFEKFQTDNNQFMILEGDSYLLNGGSVEFYLKFIPSNAHDNNRFFIGLDAEGDITNAPE